MNLTLKLSRYFIVILFFTNCKSNQGTVIQGKGGEIESGKITVRCSKPLKTYTKELEGKLDGELDSLSNISNSKLELSLKNKVVKLTQYTSEGLDRDLMYFRICEIANNRGLTNEQTVSLLEKSLDAFDKEVKKKSRQ